MCATCGCSDEQTVRVIDVRPGSAAQPHTHADGHTHTHDDDHDGGHDHDHNHTHSHDGSGAPAHSHPHPGEMATETLTLETRILAKNDELAADNRAWLRDQGVAAINLMSSPGSGKTTLLERTVGALAESTSVCVIEGDQETTFDADRIAAAGAPVLQVNTGSGCHLDASMVRTALRTLDPQDGIVLIENVGNLVCPALFDLGEHARVVIMSVTEGADKPLKYPHMFSSATMVVLNKIDLLPHVDFDLARFERDVELVNHHTRIMRLSATRGDGISEWLDWLQSLPAQSSRTHG
jgi:hydrogenase nickel incorporation protein HypB